MDIGLVDGPDGVGPWTTVGATLGYDEVVTLPWNGLLAGGVSERVSKSETTTFAWNVDDAVLAEACRPISRCGSVCPVLDATP